jgi:NADH-quinone oxidoreductase subunit F
MAPHILLRHRDIPDIGKLDVYIKNGGFEAFKKVVTTMTPQQVIEEVKSAGLRGRGGAGFPTGVKWSFLTKNSYPRYVVVNSDESEPGTFKDREIMEKNPYQFIEGSLICAFAAEANIVYNYVRGEYWDVVMHLDACLAELRGQGIIGPKASYKTVDGKDYAIDFYNHLGAGAYICGEESALLESLEGKLGQPRLKPPFPADKGLFAKPTVVNNTETLTNVPYIISEGVEAFRKNGTEKSPGTKVFSLSGNINKPGNYEMPLGATLRTLIFEHGGGIPGDKKVKAVMLAGASSVVLEAKDDILDMPLDYESTAAKGASLGSASVIIMDETVDMTWVTLKTTRFFKHESCGKCTPCREGTYWMLNVLERINKGEGKKADIELLGNIAGQIAGKCLCPLGEFSVTPVVSSLKTFRADFDAHATDAPKPKPAAKPAAAKPAPKKEPVAGD